MKKLLYAALSVSAALMLGACAIFASCPEGNAQSFSAKLKKKGFNEAAPYHRGRMVRVIYGHYPTEQAAQTALNKLQYNKEFADAWVMEIK